jgi:hypothetical protein
MSLGMLKFFLSLFLGFLGWGLPIWAQQGLVQLKGQLVSETDGSPVPYASLRLEGKSIGAVSNAEGEFTLALHEDLWATGAVLKVSCLGFESRRIPVNQLDPDQFWVLELSEKPYSLAAVMIYSSEMDAREMVRQALRQIPLLYPRDPYQWQSFYRHYCWEGETYGRLIEAVVDLYDEKGHQRMYKHPGRKLQMRLKQLRRSFDFTRFSAYQHVPIALNVSLQADLVSYPSLLSRHVNSRKLQFRYVDTTYYDGEVVYVVEAQGRAEKLNFKGVFYLQASNLAFLKADLSYESSYQGKSWFRQRKDHFVLNYRLHEGYYYLDYLLNEGSILAQQLDARQQVIFTDDHHHHVEMMTQEIRTENLTPFTGQQPTAEQMKRVLYDPAFWGRYSVLQATPLEQEIEADLARRFPLGQQFDQAQTENLLPDVQDWLAQRHLEALLQHHQGRIILLGFWDSYYSPGLSDLVKARRLLKRYQEEPITVVLISTDENDYLWKEAIRKKRLYGPEHVRLGQGMGSPVAQSYGLKSVPYFVLLGRKGEILLAGSKIPDLDQLESVLSE